MLTITYPQLKREIRLARLLAKMAKGTVEKSPYQGAYRGLKRQAGNKIEFLA